MMSSRVMPLVMLISSTFSSCPDGWGTPTNESPVPFGVCLSTADDPILDFESGIIRCDGNDQPQIEGYTSTDCTGSASPAVDISSRFDDFTCSEDTHCNYVTTNEYTEACTALKPSSTPEFWTYLVIDNECIDISSNASATMSLNAMDLCDYQTISANYTFFNGTGCDPYKEEPAWAYSEPLAESGIESCVSVQESSFDCANAFPTFSPTSSPTTSPTGSPTSSPTTSPSAAPITASPTATGETHSPSKTPTAAPQVNSASSEENTPAPATPAPVTTSKANIIANPINIIVMAVIAVAVF